jgi:tetratricopeptide (TPR) repeat protein
MTDPSQLYAQLVAAFNQGHWNETRALALQLLPLAPRHPGVYSIAGVTCMELHQLDPAIDYLRRAAELDPNRADFATLYAKALSMSELHGEALDAADRAIALCPDDPMTLDTLGMICIRAQAHEKATIVFRRAVALSPANAQCRFNLATALVTMGEIDAAELAFEACISLAPNYWNPHLSLAQLHRQTQARNHVARLHSLLARNHSDIRAQTYLNMALAKEYEDLAEYPKAFDHLTRAKTAGRNGLRYSMDHDEDLFELLIRTFPEPQPAPTGDPNDESIFVVGMPRTGTTLVERILSSHPDVYGAGELRNFAEALQRVSGHPTSLISDPVAMAQVHALDWKRLGTTYISSTRPATGHTPRFVDKLPHNFLFIGFIARALPNARIICLRRDPMDTCVSNFRQLFEQTSSHFGYSFDLLDTGRYYVLFDRLMQHWKRVFPGRILEVGYEDLIETQETTTRQLLDFCGLPWHEACLHFEQNPAPVATLSATQVRAPIYATSVGRWRRYAPQLADLLSLLTSAGVHVGKSAGMP